MAERRMFAKTIIDSDAFLDMPLSAQALYFHLSMRADDEGFINNPKRIQRMIGASEDDLKLLIAKSFIIAFDSGVIVIKHWKIHNYIQKDRYKATPYTEEKDLLETKENGSYTLKNEPESVSVYSLDTDCIQNGYSLDTQVRLGKDRLVEDRIVKDRVGKVSKEHKGDAERPVRKGAFKPPTIEEVTEYCIERGNRIDPEAFIDYYSSQRWRKSNGQVLSDWKAAVRTWEKRDNERSRTAKKESTHDFLRALAEGREYDETGSGIIIDSHAVDIS